MDKPKSEETYTMKRGPYKKYTTDVKEVALDKVKKGESLR